MLFSVFLVLFLPCAGMSVVFVVYICLLWYAAVGNSSAAAAPAAPAAGKGLTAADLEKIPRIAGRELVMGSECAVCLDEIEEEQAARMIPGCNHGFHVECADAWLSTNPICPLCRARLDPDFFAASTKENQNPC